MLVAGFKDRLPSNLEVICYLHLLAFRTIAIRGRRCSCRCLENSPKDSLFSVTYASRNMSIFKWCAVLLCPNNNMKNSTKHFFPFPCAKSHKRQRDLWLNALNRKNIAPETVLYCCEDHFSASIEIKSIIILS